MMVWKMVFFFRGCILRFHVNLPGVYVFVVSSGIYPSESKNWSCSTIASWGFVGISSLKQTLGGGNSNIFNFTLKALPGEMIQFDKYFSNWLKPPPRTAHTWKSWKLMLGRWKILGFRPMFRLCVRFGESIGLYGYILAVLLRICFSFFRRRSFKRQMVMAKWD